MTTTLVFRVFRNTITLICLSNGARCGSGSVEGSLSVTI